MPSPPLPASPRPGPEPVLGHKALACFLWSAEHDDDAEFLRRYGEPTRAKFMLEFHGLEKTACLRLLNLLQA